MKGLLVVLLLGAMSLPLAAMAGQWAEQGDAPDLPPGQMTSGNGPLTAITGSLAAADADLYCINVPTPAAFTATTCVVVSYDTQLWIFDTSGIGISMDDDDPYGCGVQSTVTGTYIRTAGNYLLGITSYNLNAYDANGEIWQDSPFNVERPPDGPGAPGPVTYWADSAYNTGAYTITLTGANFCSGATATENVTFGKVKAIFR